jgi:hypothetical protein
MKSRDHPVLGVPSGAGLPIETQETLSEGGRRFHYPAASARCRPPKTAQTVPIQTTAIAINIIGSGGLVSRDIIC